MSRRMTGLAIYTIIISISAIFLGLGIIAIGDEVSSTGGAFGNELATLGGLWTAMGVVLVILGVLGIPMALGIARIKEWGRKNGVYIAYLIAAILILAGFLVAYFSPMEAPKYFFVSFLAIILGRMLWEKKTLYELGPRAPDAYEYRPTYREVRHVEKKVVAVRQAASAPKYEFKQTVKCSRCGTVNDGDRQSCKMCAKPL